MEFVRGMVVISRAGRDKGYPLAVLGSENGRIIVADGGERPLSRPKKKNPLHLAATKKTVEVDNVSDKALRRALRGIMDRDKAGDSEVLCIYADGSMKIVDPSSVTAQELVDQGVWQAFSFGPGLVEDGEISVSLDSEVGRAKASNPRTAIGIIDDLHYVFVVSDGRTDDSEGVSLYELASFMEQLGVQTAYNLDGGGSSTMVFRNQIINNPTGGFGNREREVSDIVYIG